MAIQFPDFASIILQGTVNANAAKQAQANADRTTSQNVLYGVEGLASGMENLIKRGREKKAGEIIEQAIEDKRRYLAGEVTDEAEKAKFSKLYDVPESEQWLALAGRVAPYSATMGEALTKRGAQARVHEDEIAKLGGDPQTIKLQNYVKSLADQRSSIVKGAFDSLESLDLNDALNRMRGLGAQIDAANAEIGKRLGLETSSPASGEAPTPVAKLDDYGQQIAQQKLLEMRGLTSAKDAQAFLDAVRNDPEIPIAVKGVIASFGLPRLEELRKMDKDLQQLDQAERRIEMENGDKYFGGFVANRAKLQTELDGLRGIVEGWEGKPPTSFAQAKARLQSLDGALRAARVASGTTETDNSILTLIQSAIGLADREELTADQYNEAVGSVINSIWGQASGHNRNVENLAKKHAASPYLKSRADAVLLELGEKPKFAKSETNFNIKSLVGSGNGGNGGEEDDPLAGMSPEQIEALKRRLGKK